jgi:hypothetical protein
MNVRNSRETQVNQPFGFFLCESQCDTRLRSCRVKWAQQGEPVCRVWHRHCWWSNNHLAWLLDHIKKKKDYRDRNYKDLVLSTLVFLSFKVLPFFSNLSFYLCLRKDFWKITETRTLTEYRIKGASQRLKLKKYPKLRPVPIMGMYVHCEPNWKPALIAVFE